MILRLVSQAFYPPIDKGFPKDGILAMGQQSQESALILADLDLEAMHQARQNGQVRNFQDRVNITSADIEKIILPLI